MSEITRQHNRYNTSVPLEFKSNGMIQRFPMKDLAEGGLCFISDYRISTGKMLHLFIKSCTPTFDGVAKVQWCKQQEKSYLVGVTFRAGSENYIDELIEQVFYLEDYCSQMEGSKKVSREQAAAKWVRTFKNFWK